MHGRPPAWPGNFVLSDGSSPLMVIRFGVARDSKRLLCSSDMKYIFRLSLQRATTIYSENKYWYKMCTLRLCDKPEGTNQCAAQHISALTATTIMTRRRKLEQP